MTDPSAPRVTMSALTRLLTRLEEEDAALLPKRDFGGQIVYEVVPASAAERTESKAAMAPSPHLASRALTA